MSTEPGAVISCVSVSKAYQQGSQTVEVLRDLSCQIEAGELVAIIGSSGSGKSTLLNLMGGLDDPDGGDIYIQGQAVRPMSESARARWRNRHLGFVYQFHHLLAEFSAQENVAIPNLIAGVERREATRRAAVLLDRVGLSGRLEHRPSALSGGERQRVAIARALATSPGCVLMDEPTGNLDPATAAQVLGLLLELNRDLGISFVIVTHDLAIARHTDRILELRNGQLLPVADDLHA
ncbi:MAG: lipoprotein-releasing system ATP-binding protein LolD [Porticoccaceae bacterium]|nr:lipoprotein-releasing system ATP-binding protein LolD [Porticoccaceae bacterium]